MQNLMCFFVPKKTPAIFNILVFRANTVRLLCRHRYCPSHTLRLTIVQSLHAVGNITLTLYTTQDHDDGMPCSPSAREYVPMSRWTGRSSDSRSAMVPGPDTRQTGAVRSRTLGPGSRTPVSSSRVSSGSQSGMRQGEVDDQVLSHTHVYTHTGWLARCPVSRWRESEGYMHLL